MEAFEKHLRRQPLREIPRDWREDILATARRAAVEVRSEKAQESWVHALRAGIRGWLWPHPAAWGMLGACWIVIGALDFAAREPEVLAVGRATSMSVEAKRELKQERLMLVELSGGPEKPELDRARKPATPPRTERSWVKMV